MTTGGNRGERGGTPVRDREIMNRLTDGPTGCMDSNTSLVLFSIVLIISSLPLFYFSLGRTGNGWMDGIGMGWDGKGRQAKERYGRKRIYVFRFPPPLFWLCVYVCVCDGYYRAWKN